MPPWPLQRPYTATPERHGLHSHAGAWERSQYTLLPSLDNAVKKLRDFLFRALSEIHIHLPVPGIRNPVFIVGCGRSGTTILGTALAMHPAVTYLNEPRNLWHRAYPETYIWIKQARLGTGKLVFTEADEVPAKTRKLSRLLAWETWKTGRPVLIEKLPINTFRLHFIRKMFPEARYIHILRDGIEVARSMHQLVDGRKWIGAEGYKWKLLAQLAQSREDTRPLADFCADAHERGLLEWRLSVESWLEFSRGLPERTCCEITYEDLVTQPVETLHRCLQFLNLEPSPLVDDFARTAIRRQSGGTATDPLSERETLIAGELLHLVRNRTAHRQ